MNLQKAIEIKQRYYNGGELPSASNYREADKLSIEALKTIESSRRYKTPVPLSLLPGETEE